MFLFIQSKLLKHLLGYSFLVHLLITNFVQQTNSTTLFLMLWHQFSFTFLELFFYIVFLYKPAAYTTHNASEPLAVFSVVSCSDNIPLRYSGKSTYPILWLLSVTHAPKNLLRTYAFQSPPSLTEVTVFWATHPTSHIPFGPHKSSLNLIHYGWRCVFLHQIHFVP